MGRLKITYPGKSISGTLDLPGSKSIANRLLMIKELSGSPASIQGLPDSSDTLLMINLLEKIREAKKQHQEDEVIIDCGNTGTVFRFLTSYLSLTPGNWILTGSSRMEERTIGSLVDALIELGAAIEYISLKGFPPLRIRGKPFHGYEASVSGKESSQYISSLLMVAPGLPAGLDLHLKDEKVSEPYIEMTLALMRGCGIRILPLEDGYSIPPQQYVLKDQVVEKDWSSASYWYETLVLAGEGKIVLKGLRENSCQGDSELVNIYSKLGINSEFSGDVLTLTTGGRKSAMLNFNMKDYPDIVPSLSVALAGIKAKGSISGIHHLRLKESDRIESLQLELNKAGYPIQVNDNNLIFKAFQRKQKKVPELSSHNDHRMAMSLAPLSLIIKQLIIDDPEVVNKSYPGFWKDMEVIGFQLVKL